MKACTACFLALSALLPLAAHAGDRLLGTGGVTSVEGAGGGGLTPWATIAGTGSANQTGGVAFATRLETNGRYRLDVVGAALGWHDRLEVSASRWTFDLADVVPGKTIAMDVLGAKIKVLGDAVYDQDSWVPQVSLGAQYKVNESDALVKSLGAQSSRGVDVYASATKLWLGAAAGRNVLASVTTRMTKANQFGLVGFGGPRSQAYQLKLEGSVGLMLRDDLVVGAEIRQRPNNLQVDDDAATLAYKENMAHDVYIAWFPCRGGSITAAWVNLGNVVSKADQMGWYLSGQWNF
ncbi:MAG: DUF3034 family protein [Aquabacterium sp.]|jgi:hypothetical protein|nr:DUF3034 family protein [Aquabacterium sp.]